MEEKTDSLDLGSADFDLWDLETRVEHTQASPSAGWTQSCGLSCQNA